ncbi:TPA: hypothetical protein ACVO3F_003863 [Vibrio diabolicus]
MSRYQYQPLASWGEFERLCCDLFKNDWNSRVTSLHGRNGSRQNGVDIYGYPDGGREIWGVQCKGKEIYPEKKITIEQIEEEIDKALGFEPELAHYIFATTMRRDVKLQRELRKLVRQKELPFGVEIKFWDDIEDALDEVSHIADKYYPRKAEEIKKNGLFDRNDFDDRVNLISVYQGEREDELVFNCRYYNLRGLMRNNEVWLEFGWDRSFSPRVKEFIKNARIDTKRIADWVEEFYFNEQVDGFSVNYNLEEIWGSVQICNDDMIMSGDYYTSGSDVYTDTDSKIDEYQTNAYFEIFGVLQEVARTIKE